MKISGRDAGGFAMGPSRKSTGLGRSTPTREGRSKRQRQRLGEIEREYPELYELVRDGEISLGAACKRAGIN